ncbi:hypothetical protein ACHAXR_011341 [Thalassiosira sp. AJA248-18]
MQRLLVGSAASSLRRRQLLLATCCQVSPRRFAATPINAPPPPYPIRAAERRLPTTLHIQSNTFSTNSNDGSLPTTSKAKSPNKKKLGFIARIRRTLRTLFGNNDDTPRGIQEKKDMYWIVLAVAHRKLRMEHQTKFLELQHSNNNDHGATTSEQPSQLVWQEESKEKLTDLMDEAVSHLDDNTDINELSLQRLRSKVQSFLEPQIVHLLTGAHDVEEEVNLIHGVDDDDNEDYALSEKEEQEYKEILIREYENVCQLLLNEGKMDDVAKKSQRTSDPVPFYEIKKGAIEWLLTYFDWWPQNADIPIKSIDAEYVDEFGFSPNKSDSDILPAMRYYHVRNLVRSSLVRQRDAKAHNCYSYHSLLPFRSTIPSAGRGVFIDGFAPAGTLLSFFPGKVWPKEHLQTASLQTQMQFSDNDPRHQLSMRYDDILIDSRQSPYTVVKNLWALGHIFNHPPAPPPSVNENSNSDNNANNIPHHQGPNCITVPINITDRMLRDQPDKFREYIPNEYEMLPKPWAKNAFEKDEIIMHGMGLIALRDVKDEELFYDYRLSPDNNQPGGLDQYPSWYYVWDKEAINNRWEIDDD